MHVIAGFRMGWTIVICSAICAKTLFLARKHLNKIIGTHDVRNLKSNAGVTARSGGRDPLVEKEYHTDRDEGIRYAVA